MRHLPLPPYSPRSDVRVYGPRGRDHNQNSLFFPAATYAYSAQRRTQRSVSLPKDDAASDAQGGGATQDGGAAGGAGGVKDKLRATLSVDTQARQKRRSAGGAGVTGLGGSRSVEGTIVRWSHRSAGPS